jgi:hypothetical protein
MRGTAVIRQWVIVLVIALYGAAVSPGACDWTGNLLRNPGFEEGVTYWGYYAYPSVTAVEESPHSGAWSLRAGPDAGGRSQAVALPLPDTTYTLGVWGRMSADGDISGTCGVEVYDGTGQRHLWYVSFTRASYEYQEVQFTTPATIRSLIVYVWKDASPGYVYVDDVSLTADATTSPGNTSYYVDAAAGLDDNAGTSPETAWRTLSRANRVIYAPGDRIWLRSGCAWRGQFWPKGSGAEGNPIVVDSYGDGAKPVIYGLGWAQAAVQLYNQQCWEISNLDISNTGSSRAIRQGVLVLGEDYGLLHHVYLRNLSVHDVNGAFDSGRDGGKCNGGIVFDVQGSAVRTRFHDVLIEGCSLRNCDRTGIKTWSDWSRWNCATWEPYTNLVIRNNVLDDIGGDGIVPCQADAPRVEYNVASNCNRRSGVWNVAIWCWDTDDAVLQYNEAYLTHTALDGQGFDIDGFTRRTVLQYNHSHDNEGGFLLICNYPDAGPCYFNEDAVVRYNISQSDRAKTFHLAGKVTNARLYNNTIYVDSVLGNVPIVRSGEYAAAPDHTQFYNNIIWNEGTGGYELGISTNNVFDSNVFYGDHPASEPADPHKLTSNPGLLAAGRGSTGRSTTDAYRLRPDSPCIDSGLTLPDNGGQDYWGNPVPFGAGADRGAHEYSGETGTVELAVEATRVTDLPVAVDPADLFGRGNGTTPFTRVYAWGEHVGIFAPFELGADRLYAWYVDGVRQYYLSNGFDLCLGRNHNVIIRYRPFFYDVGSAYWAHDQVIACAEAGVVGGYAPGRYAPGREVARDQMAVYLARALAGGDAAVPEGPTTPSFSDVATNHWAYKYIEFIRAANVAGGYLGATYRPALLVDRGQMAVYVARACVAPAGDAVIPDPPAPLSFPDVTPDNAWAWCLKHVEYISARGIARGYSDGTYRPEYTLTRDQMAVYVQRAFALPM